MCCQKFVKMGCIASKAIDDTYPNVFKVINVDDLGNQMGSGLLEIRNFEIVLYQKGKTPITWPLKTLRRYGFDADHFSFESGRRCRTGPGIYAFRCQKAEQLFNLIQSRIESRESHGNDDSERSMFLRNSASFTNSLFLGDASSRRLVPNRFPSQLRTGRHSSSGNISGGLGLISPMSATSAPIIMDTALPSINLPDVPENSLPAQFYENDDVVTATVKRNLEENLYEEQRQPFSAFTDHSYENHLFGPTNAFKANQWNTSASDIQIVLLEEVETPPSPEADAARVYMNMLPGTEPVIQEVIEPEPVPEPEEICKSQPQVNLFDFKNGSELGGGSLHRFSEDPTLPTSPRAVKSLNYIVLDLEQNGDLPKSPTSPNPSENGKRLSEGYTSIDFQKTVALSHSIHPDSNMDRDSCRKTRHSSNAFPHERHGSSVSD